MIVGCRTCRARKVRSHPLNLDHALSDSDLLDHRSNVMNGQASAEIVAAYAWSAQAIQHHQDLRHKISRNIELKVPKEKGPIGRARHVVRRRRSARESDRHAEDVKPKVTAVSILSRHSLIGYGG